jgi:hypothetical protein
MYAIEVNVIEVTTGLNCGIIYIYKIYNLSMQSAEIDFLLQSKGEFMEADELINIIKMEFAEVEDENISAVLALYLPQHRKLERV